MPLQVAEHDRGAERLGQPVELLVQLGPGLGGGAEAGSDAPTRSSRRRSSSRRRDRSRRARAAIRRATPYSQLATESPRRIVPARRARTRKAAWQASSASCRSPRIARQTPSTIGPWRSTRAVKAASASETASPAPPRPSRNRSRSWPSVRPESVPTPKSVLPTMRPDRRPASPHGFRRRLDSGIVQTIRGPPEAGSTPSRFRGLRRSRFPHSGHDRPAMFPVSCGTAPIFGPFRVPRPPEGSALVRCGNLNLR